MKKTQNLKEQYKSYQKEQLDIALERAKKENDIENIQFIKEIKKEEEKNGN